MDRMQVTVDQLVTKKRRELRDNKIRENIIKKIDEKYGDYVSFWFSKDIVIKIYITQTISKSISYSCSALACFVILAPAISLIFFSPSFIVR